jgi:hypothetical protein
MGVTINKNQKLNTMKTLIITALLATISLTSYANDEGEKNSRKEVANQARELIMNEDLFDAMDFNGEVSVSFTIDEQDRIHVNSVETEDFTLEYHIRQSLQNVKVEASETLVGKTIGFVVDIVSAK